MANYNTISNYKITINTQLPQLEKKLNKLEHHLSNIAYKTAKDYAVPKIVNEMQSLIMAGGSSIHALSWGYWKEAGDSYTYVKGKAPSFNFSTKSKAVKRYPIHPNSYLKRKVRTRPKSGQYALYDTGKMYNSFRIVSSYKRINDALVSIGSTDRKFDLHEDGIKVPQRMVLKPVAIWFENSSVKKEMIDKIIKEFEHKVK